MNCNSIEKLFERFLDGDDSPAEHGHVLRHVDRCARCRDVLAELRVVDALLLTPRLIELAPNFTFATMAEARALPVPSTSSAPIQAYIVSYLVAAWMLAGAMFVLAPHLMSGAAGTLFAIVRSIADALGGLGASVSHALGRGGSGITAMLGALLALDVTLAVAFGVALTYVRPRRAQRSRP